MTECRAQGSRLETSPARRTTLVQAARRYRRAPTTSEALLWEALRGRRLGGRKFRRQPPIGGYVVDFFCAEERLVVEVDGGIHRDRAIEDRERQELLELSGLHVVRVPASLVEKDLAAVLARIEAAIRSPLRAVGEGMAEGQG